MNTTSEPPLESPPPPAKKEAWRELPLNWQHFLASIIFVVVFPLLPVLIEWWQSSYQVGSKTLTITVALWTIAVGVSSKQMFTFAVCVFISVIFAVVFGVAVSQGLEQSASRVSAKPPDSNTATNVQSAASSSPDTTNPQPAKQPKEHTNEVTPLPFPHVIMMGYLVIFFVSIYHGYERYQRHVVIKEPFLVFLGSMKV